MQLYHCCTLPTLHPTYVTPYLRLRHHTAIPNVPYLCSQAPHTAIQNVPYLCSQPSHSSTNMKEPAVSAVWGLGRKTRDAQPKSFYSQLLPDFFLNNLPMKNHAPAWQPLIILQYGVHDRLLYCIVLYCTPTVTNHLLNFDRSVILWESQV